MRGEMEAQTRKKLSLFAKIAIVVGALILVVAIVALTLGGTLMGRLAPQGTIVFGDDEEHTPEPPVVTPNTGTQGQNPVSTPTQTPVLTPEPALPLEELYEQTHLTDEQKLNIEKHLKDTVNYTNILLVGVDRRGTTGNSRADTIMIATIDKKNDRIKLTSILRDLYVPIPGHDPWRINSAASKGGIELLMQTINEAFHLNLEKYVMVDFQMFEKGINKLGGVTIKMSAREIAAANDCIAGLNKQRGVEYLWDGFIFANAGNVKLTGKQALGYARIRKIDSDTNRTNRQFNVLNAVFAKFKDCSLAEQYDLLYDLLPMVETNLNMMEILDCALSVFTMDTPGLMHETYPKEDLSRSTTMKGSYILLPDLPANALSMHEFMFENAQVPEEAEVLRPGKSLPPRTPSPVTPEITISPDPNVIDPNQNTNQTGDGWIWADTPTDSPDLWTSTTDDNMWA